MEILEKFTFLDIFQSAEKSNSISLDFSAFFSLFLFLLFLPVASLLKNFRGSIIQKGNSYQVMKREIFPLFSSLKFINVSVCI